MSGRIFTVLALLGASLLFGACGSDDESSSPPPVSGCPYTSFGACVGVPQGPLCAADACTEGATCAAVHDVASDADLASAASSAAPGDCLVLAPGSYGSLTVARGVGVLGRGADFVNVASLHVTAGAGEAGLVRGLTVGAGGVTISPATSPTAIGDVHLDAVRVSKASGDAVVVDTGSKVEITRSEILAAGGVGLRADDAAALDLDGVAFADGEAPGVIVRCADACTCAARPTLHLAHTLVQNATHVGVYVSGADATLGDVTVASTRVDGLAANSGGGLVATGCASLDATGLDVSGSAFFGVLIDGASAHLGKPGEANGIIIHANVLGLWIQGKDATADITGLIATKNAGVGLGSSGEAKGIIIHASQIHETVLDTLPVEGGSSEQVGDGLLWSGTATVVIDGLTIGKSARRPFLIDGSVGTGSSIANLVLEGGDEATGVLQQELDASGTTPDVGAGAPAVKTDTAKLFAIPVAPGVPTAP